MSKLSFSLSPTTKILALLRDFAFLLLVLLGSTSSKSTYALASLALFLVFLCCWSISRRHDLAKDPIFPSLAIL